MLKKKTFKLQCFQKEFKVEISIFFFFHLRKVYRKLFIDNKSAKSAFQMLCCSKDLWTIA